MAAQIISLSIRRLKGRRAYTGHTIAAAAKDPSAHSIPASPNRAAPKRHPHVPNFQFWSGASGDRYIHTIYPLLTCPQLPAGNFILVKRSPDGNCRPLAVGRTQHNAPSLNLAQIRHLAARLGANEVHAHLLANGPGRSKLIEHDISARYFAPRHSTTHH